jgi:multiple sugar transport system substrate-binding protein
MRRFLSFAISLLLLAGCADISSLLSTLEPEPSPQGISPPTNTSSTPVMTPESVTTTPQVTPGGPRTLRIWVPPQFDPAAETPAGTLLQERLDEFMARRPGLQVEVRVKAESMLNSLVTTQAAAPTITPDLVALSRPDLEAATASGLLHPLDGLSTLPDDPDWYPYARQMAHIQNTVFGLPFAGDALILAGYENPLTSNWNELTNKSIFIFPAADPQGMFSLSLYLSAGGTLLDDQGLPKVDEVILTDVLSLYQPSEENGFLYSSVTEVQSDDQAWSALLEQRGTLATGWVSNYLQNPTPTLNIAPLPGLESGRYTLATGWSWALAGSNLENQPLAVELAEFLSDSQFLAEWTQAAGYLPTRPTALSSWNDVKFKLEIAQTAETANLAPSQELITIVGPLLAEATIAVINGEQSPAEAAQSVAEQLK